MKVVIPNAVELVGPAAEVEPPDFGDELFTLKEVAALETGATRSSGTQRQLEVQDKEIMEVTLDDGSRWYLGPEERAELLATQPAARGIGGDELVLDSLFLADGDSRGFVSDVIKRVKVFTIEMLGSLAGDADKLAKDQVSSAVQDGLGSLVIDPIAYVIARRLEKKLATKGVSRLCKVVATGQSDVKLEPLDKKALASLCVDGKPTLLLLHGTLSSTEGSFGELWHTRQEDFQTLQRFYGDRIIALEHCTLTESPVSNALLVAESLPDQCHLHLLSHSRGGLVGELLCRGTREDKAAFSPDEIALFDEQQKAGRRELDVSRLIFDALRDHYATELANLQALNKRLNSQSLLIDRFVRVACPARGTTLASGKLHRWSNRAFNAVGILGGQSLNPVYNAFQAFTLSTLKSNTKAEVLPGLQAQMPSSALIHVLNNSEDDVPADLSVLAGDIEIEGRFNWKRIPLWLTDRFYGGSNDLVVNTASMDGGAKRKDGLVALQVVGDHVNHFSYFSNADSASQLVKRLTCPPIDTPRFARYERPADVYIPRSGTPQRTGDRPVLLLVPGIMGSELDINGKKIWVHAPSLLRGRIRDLSFENRAPEISAPDVMEKAYGDFIQHMSRTHDVYVCAYDWRCSLSDSARILAGRIEELLKLQEEARQRQPIRIVAHSMGGLVTRMMMASFPELWEKVVAHAGSRLLMAGTPTNGSYSINRILSGQDRLIKLLALADLRNSKADIMNLVAEYPGLATMLPGFGTLEWLQPATWDEVRNSATASDWSLPEESLLTLGRRERKMILDTPLDPALVAYVAGQSDKTVVDAFWDEKRQKEICFRYTGRGDGQVTWDSGIPSGLDNVWYQPSVHGSLLAEPQHFRAWEQLLETGSTQELSKSAPETATRGAAETWTETTDTEVIDYLPDNDTLLSLALGMEPVHQGAARTSSTKLEVTVAHGDLSFARYPVAVGHYEGDSILHAESALDRALDFRLSERHSIGQYPGEIGSSEVVFARSARGIPEGALIVGLGQLGELTAATLERTLTQGIVNYIFEFNEWWAGQDRDQEPPEIGLSVLLIGSGVGVLTVRDSVGALLQAVRTANSLFRDKGISRFSLLERLEIVELWQDLALEAIEMAMDWGRDMPDLSVGQELHILGGGSQRSRFQGSSDWWHTINVKLSDDKTEYLYDDFTRFARNELTREPMDRNFVDMFLEQIIHSPHYDRNAASSPQEALFQLLLPGTIKEKSPDSDKLLLILDESTARIPWEMLVDGWAKGNKEKVPLAVSKTLMRRLSMEHFRSRPEPALGNQALVVGDPPSGSDPYKPLKGAREEARAVARLLQINRQFEVTSCIADDNTDQYSPDMALRLIESLYSQEFRILHFAGHGSYYRESASVRRNPHDEGMVIGEGLRLTPTLISKMPRTPTLVFLNCCHLGYIEERSEDKRVRYNHIAANLATQFLKLGTRVVVAAGWEVNDVAAKRFAEVFYDHLLANEKLGYAISEARKITYEQFGNTNTFGAYQCWGDPEFRLDPRKGTTRSGYGGNRFVSAFECELQAVNIRNAARTAKAGYLKTLELQIDGLLRELSDKYGDPWMSPDIRRITGKNWDRPRTRALAQLGRAYGELGRFEMAVKLLRAANSLNPAALSVHDLEQLGNFECRCAVQIHYALRQNGKHPLPELGTAKSVFNAGKRRLKRLLTEYSRSGQQMVLREIHCLLGSAAKRQAMLEDDGGKVDVSAISGALADMCFHYGSGWAGGSATETQTVDAYIHLAAVNQEPPAQYAFENFALAVILSRWFDDDNGAAALSEPFIGQLRQLTIEAGRQSSRAESFWQAISPSNAVLLQFLDDEVRQATGVYDDMDHLAEAISEVLKYTSRRFGSERQWCSVRDHLHFVARMLHMKPEVSKAQSDADKVRIDTLNNFTSYIEDLANAGK